MLYSHACMQLYNIKELTKDETVNIVLDTIEKQKQALIFTSSKASAEKTADEIAKKQSIKPELAELAEQIQNALSTPTRQCLRLAQCIKRGIAFHHAGLIQEQKEAIEDAFREGKIKIIAATPTLAIGVDLPSYRTIIKSLKRYSGRFGMQYIPVLEYHQMAGRSGRPGKDTRGEAITIAGTEKEKENIYEKYVTGKPEEIYSKLAVEPVLRMYILSLVASNVVRTKKELIVFFEKTFWAFQFQDMQRLTAIIDKMLMLLEKYRFLQQTASAADFVAASEIQEEKLAATLLGERVAQLYLDPMTADLVITTLEDSITIKKELTAENLLHLFSNTLELRPLIRVKTKDYEEIEQAMIEKTNQLLVKAPPNYDEEYEEYLNSIKTTMLLSNWIEEKTEEHLLEKYDTRPGELREKLQRLEWICYATAELCKLCNLKTAMVEIYKLNKRLQYGAKEELLPLLRLKNIGRIRARKLFNNKIKDLGDVKNADLTTLTQLVGAAIAMNIKKQVGEEMIEEISTTKRKGQMSLGKYGE